MRGSIVPRGNHDRYPHEGKSLEVLVDLLEIALCIEAPTVGLCPDGCTGVACRADG